MGMDVHGRGNPEAYFRANIFSWPSVLHVVEIANNIHNLGIDITHWVYNDGDGLKTAEECEKLADAIEKTLPTLVGKHEPEPLESAKRLSAVFGFEAPRVQVDPERIGNFVKFLRECKGFQIF